MVDKGFNLRVSECKQDLVKVLNESALPISILAMIMKEVNDIVLAKQSQVLEQEQLEYYKALEEQKKVEDDKKKKK